MPSKPKTIKELKEQRRRENFVGRSEQQQIFLDNFTGDEVKWVVLSVTGEGGVGKSTLLKRYTQLAHGDEINANVVYCDDRQYAPVDAMTAIAEQLAKVGIVSKKFDERHKKYRETLQQIECDPSVPRGMVNVVTRGLTDFTIKSLRRVPGVGIAADYVDEQAAGDAMVDLAQYAIARWGNKDETLLVREPEKILTPLFVELLNEAAQKQRLVVMFDVFERTASTLSTWIIELVDSEHGDLDLGVSFLISGRDMLEQHWTELAGLMSHVQLEPFTLDETAIYLSNRDVKNEMLVKQIYEDTGGLPVLVELLASTKPQLGAPLRDISKDAVERFLQWTPDEEKRHAALVASTPRQFNQEILQALLGEEKGKEAFRWLAGQSFVRSNSERGYFYHDKVRVLMLRHQRNIAPGELTGTHTLLARHFTRKQADLNLTGREAYQNQAWQRFEQEQVYHHFSVEPEKHFVHMLDSFLAAFRYRWKFSQTLVKVAIQAMADSQCNLFNKQFGELDQLLDSFDKDDYRQAKGLLNEIQAIAGISPASRAICFAYQGYVSRNLEQYEEALADFTRAIELDEKDTWAITNRGVTYRLMDRYEEALADFTRAIELDNKYTWAIANRGLTYRLMKHYEESLADFNRAIKLNEKYTWAIANRGITCRLMERYEEALADFTRAIELHDKYTWAITNRGVAYRLMERYEEALADFTRAIELNEKYTWAITNRGITYRLMEHYEEALADFTRAIELDEKGALTITNRGITYRLMDRYEEALADFTRAIELDEKGALAITNRGITYRLMEHYEEAMADFTRAIEMDEKDAWAITNRGVTYRLMEHYEEALADFTRAIELDEKDALAIINRGITYNLMERYEEALVDFTYAIELDEKDDWAIANRGETYRFMEHYEEALVDFTCAIELDEKNAWAIANRGETYRLMEHYEEALVDFTCAIELDEKNAWALQHRSELFRATRQYKLQLQDLETLETWGYKDANILFEKAEVLRRLGNLPEALETFNEIFNLLEEEIDIHYLVRRALVHKLVGNFELANTDIQRALDIPCKDVRDHYNRACAFLVSERFSDALVEFDLAFMEKAPREYSKADDLLDPIRDLPEYKAILAKYE